jgi:hypothetical protein
MTKCGFCNECKKPSTIMGPIWGIVMNVKKPATIMRSYMRVLQCLYKTSDY